ncbi:MAG: amino acid adenylation domain-containing protein [Nostoc sp. DedQUE08]|uniref:non-ribosomal peptide synthetase n=1 Tax=unclassified Nostoc TaxID=2593658 RepID=UPI002AD55FB5|nr:MULTISPECIES: non-ribosomal peptide synthetase [unclassified Nostoc]MDZ8065501.1 amino acid adenylation domain-containing protein [Nostoc sp. DedQUE08]MDZ8094195.1 amino acid adenylation domain-containing protein [Nostoc sp. DedQUE05]
MKNSTESSQQDLSLPKIEVDQLLLEWHENPAAYVSNICINQLFEYQVEKTPEQIAVIFEDKQISYQELNQRANQLAHYLQTLNVKPEVLVGIFLERSLEMIVGLLAILKAGGAYVPLDPAYPSERLALMLEDSQLSILLTQQNLLSKLPEHQAHIVCLDNDKEAITQQSQENLTCLATDKNLSYVIYTSGSTGKPKGVAIEHHSTVALLHWAKEVFTTEDLAGVLAATSICFDLSVFEIFVPLSLGGKVILAENALYLPTLLAAQEVTLINTVPSAIAELLRIQGIPASVRIVNLAGEPLQNRLVQQIYTLDNIQKVFNLYGPTEDTTYSTFALVNKGDSSVTIGRPITNTYCLLLDEQMQIVPTGVSGELYIGGEGLARGYLNRPELTDQRFIPNPFEEAGGRRSLSVAEVRQKAGGSKLYKTGDLARYLPEGNIEYIGRIDQQVKIRGFRIELGDIETALWQHPDVQEVVVIAKEFSPGDQRLVAYVVLKPESSDTNVGNLRRFIKQKLPDYMIPSRFVQLSALPLTANGKVDRKALPAPVQTLNANEKFVAPRTPIEERVAEIWSTVLGLKNIGVHDNFLALGGHSLLAFQILCRIRDIFQVELSMRHFFEAPTISEIAQSIIQAQQENIGCSVPIQSIGRDGDLPLSFGQERLWFIDQLVPNHAFYNVPEAFRLKGVLNATILEQSLNEIIKRHEVLRTTYSSLNGQPIQVIHSTFPIKLLVVNLQGLSPDEQESQVHQIVLKEAQRPFNLVQGPLLRTTLLQLSSEEHIFLLNLHHILCDDWSLSVLFEELSTLYQAFSTGNPSTLPNLAIQYADFAAWQRQSLQGEILNNKLVYWQQHLSGSLPILELPTDYPRPLEPTYQGARQSVVIPKSLTDALNVLSRQESTTLFMTLLAAFQTLLFRYTGQEDILVGAPISDRHRSELEGLIGFLLNTLVLRTNLSDSPSFRQLLGRVREVALSGYTHQDLPFEKLVDALQIERGLNQNPLISVMFHLQNTPRPKLTVPGLTMNRLEIDNGTSKFDLYLELRETAAGISGNLEYNTDLFKAETIALMVENFSTLVQSIVSNPDQTISNLPLLTFPSDRQTKRVYNGNIDIRSLPEPELDRSDLEAKFVAPRTLIESQMAEIWRRVLAIAEVGIHDNFFELGGNSLLASRLIFLVRETFQVDLPLKSLFEKSTIEALAQVIETVRRDGASALTSAIDLKSEVVLDPAIDAQGRTVVQVDELRHVFLTGATGFLGAFLIDELLHQTQAKIYCLVRSPNEHEGLEKIQQNLEKYSLHHPNFSSNVIAIPGDLEQPCLGLPIEQFEKLGLQIDAIYHSAAQVNFAKPYPAIKEPNVIGTQEVLRLACMGKIKPMHYISTVAVFGAINHFTGQKLVYEDDDIQLCKDYVALDLGYSQTKWVAENLVWVAKSRGIPVSIFRTGFLMGDSKTGIAHTKDAYVPRVIKGCIQLGSYPELIDQKEEMIPVDYASRAIVHLSKKQESLGKAFHIVPPPDQNIPLIELFEVICSYGYQLKKLPYTQWKDELIASFRHSQENALHPLLSMMSEKVYQDSLTIMELYQNTVDYDYQNTLNGLADSAIVCPPMDVKLFDKYFLYFVSSGFLNSPPLRQE